MSPGRLPYLNGHIFTARGNLRGKGRPGHGEDFIGVAEVMEGSGSGGSIPHIYSSAGAFIAGGDMFAIGRPGHGRHCTGIAMIDEQGTSRSDVPDLNRSISTARGDASIIRRPG